MLGIFFSAMLAFFSMHKIFNPPAPISPNFHIVSMILGGAVTALLSLGMRLSSGLKKIFAVLLIAAGILVYAVEVNIALSTPNPMPRKEVAAQMGIPFDTRPPLKVLQDLIDSGIDAQPNISPKLFIKSNGLDANEGRIYPLGTIPNVTTILGNELGYYPVIEADEHGFNNPKGLYEKNKVDIMLTGDSFVEGYAVHSNQNFGGVLRGLGFSVINLGKAANGPVLQFAGFKEYVEPLQPKVVLWIYYKVDILALANETTAPLLMKYLSDDNFTQHLMSRGDEIASVLRSFDQREVEAFKQKKSNKFDLMLKEVGIDLASHKFLDRPIRVLKLANLRERLNLMPRPLVPPLFKKILGKSKEVVSGGGGKLYFVYLADFDRYSTGKKDQYREPILQMLTELDIPVIDTHREVFANHPDPLSLFALRLTGHYTAEGFRLIAEAIGEKMEADGVIPSKSGK
jgi:hypothetical protein